MTNLNEPILVTGATGFVAHHLVKDLLGKGAEVVGLSLNDVSQFSHKNYSHTNIDLKDKTKLNDAIKKIKPRIVFHLAAYPDKEPSFENTDECVQNNIQGTLNLLHALSDVKYDCFVHVGSYKEYSNGKVPFKEDDALWPISSYAISKACAEMFCKSYHSIYQFPIVCLRFPTIYGPGQPKNNLVPYLINSAIKNSPLKLTSGEQKRELIYIEDAVEALQKAASTKKALGEIINIGSGKEYKIKQIVKTILKLAGSKAKPEFGAVPYRKNEIWHMRGSNEKAKNILQWNARHDLKDGLIKTIRYYKNAEE